MLLLRLHLYGLLLHKHERLRRGRCGRRSGRVARRVVGGPSRRAGRRERGRDRADRGRGERRRGRWPGPRAVHDGERRTGGPGAVLRRQPEAAAQACGAQAGVGGAGLSGLPTDLGDRGAGIAV